MCVDDRIISSKYLGKVGLIESKGCLLIVKRV